MIVAGDFGCIFGLGWRDKRKLDTLATLPYTIPHLDDNHECFPKIISCPEDTPNDGEYDEVWATPAKHGNKADVIINHAAPEETMQVFVQTGVISHRYLQEGRLNVFLENARQTVEHKHYAAIKM